MKTSINFKIKWFNIFLFLKVKKYIENRVLILKSMKIIKENSLLSEYLLKNKDNYFFNISCLRREKKV